MEQIAAQHGLEFRVYAASPWPEGSRSVFASATDWRGAFHEVKRRGVWFELGRRYDLPESAAVVGSQDLARETLRVFRALLPVVERI